MTGTPRILARMTDIKTELVGLSEYVFGARIRPRLEGLTDDEYFWEPAPRCWSLRPDPDGVLWAEGHRFVTADAPFTTLAWRLWHLICCYDGGNRRWLGAGPTDGEPQRGWTPAPASANAALTALDAAYGAWSATLDALTEEQLHEKIGPIGGQYAESSKAALVLHQLDEVIHHHAEVALMRDLYREQVLNQEVRPPSSVVDAAAGGYWGGVRELVASGAAVDGTRPGDFDRTALHYAAAGAPPDVIELLVEHGADQTAKDTQFNQTPAGWAQYFGREDIAAYLES